MDVEYEDIDWIQLVRLTDYCKDDNEIWGPLKIGNFFSKWPSVKFWSQTLITKPVKTLWIIIRRLRLEQLNNSRSLRDYI
jgi:hypothetical protein